MHENIIQAKDLLKTEGIIKETPNQTLKQALAKLTRSHDALFVFDKKFLGVINPYYAIFKSNYPPNTKLKHCLFKPPNLTPDTYIWDIAKLMVESKVYFLPVFANNHFSGIVTINRILKALIKNPNLTKNLQIPLKKELVTTYKKSSLLETYNLMRDKQVARIPVVNKKRKLVGLVTRYDIRLALAEPKQKMAWQSRAGDKNKFLDHPLDGYYKKVVATAKIKQGPQQLIAKMLEKQVGSIVIVDEKYSPIGIVSNHDILESLAKLKPQKSAEIHLKTEGGFEQKARLEAILSRFVTKINKIDPIRRLGFVIDVVKNPTGKIKRYTVSSYLLLKDGKKVIAKVTEYDWRKAVRGVLSKIRRQLP